MNDLMWVNKFSFGDEIVAGEVEVVVKRMES